MCVFVKHCIGATCRRSAAGAAEAAIASSTSGGMAPPVKGEVAVLLQTQTQGATVSGGSRTDDSRTVAPNQRFFIIHRRFIIQIHMKDFSGVFILSPKTSP